MAGRRNKKFNRNCHRPNLKTCCNGTAGDQDDTALPIWLLKIAEC